MRVPNLPFLLAFLNVAPAHAGSGHLSGRYWDCSCWALYEIWEDGVNPYREAVFARVEAFASTREFAERKALKECAEYISSLPASAPERGWLHPVATKMDCPVWRSCDSGLVQWSFLRKGTSCQ